MPFIRANTAQIVTVGPFYDKTDGVTIEGSLTITNEKVTIIVEHANGAAPTLVLDNSNGATSGTNNDLNYVANNDAGYMQLEIAATDSNYAGSRMKISITDANNHVPVFHEYFILAGTVYDSLAGSDFLQTDMIQIAGSNVANTSAQLGVNVIQAAGTAWGSGAITAGSIAANAITSAKIDANAIGAAQIDNNAIDAGAIAANAITAAKIDADAIGATQFAQGAADKVWGTAARTLTANTNLGLLTASGAATAVWDTARTSYANSGTFGQGVASVQGAVTGAVGSVTGNVGGAVVGNVGGIATSGIVAASFAANAIGAAAINDDAITAAKIANNAITVNKIANNALTADKIAANAIAADQFAQAAADKVWSTAARALTDKANFTLSSGGIDAIFDQASTVTLSFETLLTRTYQMINNRMTANESDGTIVLRNIGNLANLATGSVASSSGTTTRAELSWV